MIKVKINILFFLCFISFLNAQEKKPNILWIVCEDICPTLSMYGDFTAKTPNLDKLAKQCIIYNNSFATTGVCAASRSAIITGMLPSSIGTMHMRTAADVASWGRRTYNEFLTIGSTVREEHAVDLKGNTIRDYSVVIPANIKCFPEYLRAVGYYCTNNAKTDYQFAAPISAWDENDNKAHWRNRPKGMPFFSVFNIDDTHESKLWGNKDLPLTVDPASVPVPPYLPDNKIARNDIARHYSNIEIMDKKVGALLDELKQAGLYDNTIIFFYSDHGGPLPHQKREIYEYGLKTPLLIKGINQKNSEVSNRLISFTDLGPTVLSLANVKPPQGLDGKSFMGKYISKPRKYVYGTSDRFDEFTDRIRTVRTEQYVYIKNYYPNFTKYKDVLYRKSVPLMMNMLELKENNQLNAIQMSWFQTKEKEELYDSKKDPFSLVNLASKPEYKSVLEELRSECSKQFDQKFDFATLAESEMILNMWPNNSQPKTEVPNFKIKDKTVSLSCITKGSSISYIISDSKNEKFDLNSNWLLYSKPIQCTSGKYIYVIANRIGFKDSNITQFQFE